MDPVVPTSFIPKRPVTTDALPRRRSGHIVGLLSLITGIIVTATLVSTAGVYLYSFQLKSKKTNLEGQIEDARKGIGTDFVSDMKRLNARIEGVKTLLSVHITVSPIFAALQATTLRSVQYTDFAYTFGIDPGTKQQMVQVDLAGVAKDYATIALQSDAFSQSPLIKNPVFSNLTLDDRNGAIHFKLTFSVSPTDLTYDKFVASLPSANLSKATVQSQNQPSQSAQIPAAPPGPSQ